MLLRSLIPHTSPTCRVTLLIVPHSNANNHLSGKINWSLIHPAANITVLKYPQILNHTAALGSTANNKTETCISDYTRNAGLNNNSLYACMLGGGETLLLLTSRGKRLHFKRHLLLTVIPSPTSFYIFYYVHIHT